MAEVPQVLRNQLKSLDVDIQAQSQRVEVAKRDLERQTDYLRSQQADRLMIVRAIAIIEGAP